MLKLSDSHDFEDGSVTILNLSKGFEKKAANSEIESFLSTLDPKPGKSYLHINAMGAGEWYGSNKNGDYFPEENLKKCYKTFEANGKLFRHHQNKAHSPAYGRVVYAVYNDNLHRVELIVEADKELVQDVESRIAAGEYPKTSMACKTPYDQCYICGNKASSRQEYCSHLRSELNRMYPDGRKVMALNVGPLSFFDISLVVVPADPTSSVLRKVAGDGVEAGALGSVEAAELQGLEEHIKVAEFRKLGELLKEIQGDVVGLHLGGLSKLVEGTKDLPLDLAKTLSVFDIDTVLRALAKLGISPSVAFFAEMIAVKNLGLNYEGIGPIVEAFIEVAPPHLSVPVLGFGEGADSKGEGFGVEQVLQPFVKTSSFLPEYVEKRASGVGYSGLGPYVEPTYEEELAARRIPTTLNPSSGSEDFMGKYGKVLLALGGAALFAKYFVTKEMERQRNLAPQTKIIIIKQASDYSVAGSLSRASFPRQQLTPVNEQDSNGNLQDLGQRLTYKVSKSTLRSAGPVGGKIARALSFLGFGYKALDNR